MANQKVTLKRVIDTAGNTDNILPTTDWDQVENKPSTFTPTAHDHDASDITTGTISTARLGSGTADNTTFLRGDNTWATVDGVSNEDLQNLYIYGKASGAITKGQAVQFAGAQGGHILIKRAVPAEINAEPTLMVGIAETDLANNEFGYVIVNGRLTLNTSAYNAGDLLYFASAGSTDGALTTTEPTDPNASIQMAAVSIDGVGNGEFIVRTTILTRQINEVIGLQGALNLKAPLASPALTGVPTAPTASSGVNTTQIATTAFVQNALAGVSGGMNFVGSISLATAKNGDNLAAAGLTAPGDYLIVTATGDITNAGAILVTLAVQAPGDENDSTLPVTLETGDWIVYVSGDGSTMTVAIINNTDTRFAPTVHTHSIANVTGLQTALDGKVAKSGDTMTGALTISADANNEQLVLKRASNNNEQMIFGFHSSDYAQIQAVEQGVTFRSLALNPNGGNVGIGTTSPASKLHIYDTSGANEIFLGEGAAADKSGILKYNQGNGTGTGTLQFGHWGDNLSTNGITIKKGGNVGIGTTSPSAKLHVAGTIKADALDVDGYVVDAGSGVFTFDGDTIWHGGNLTNLNQLTNGPGYITSADGGNAATSEFLLTRDNRTIAPSEDTAFRLRYGFTSWNNNNTAPYADYLHLRSYSDASGGKDNLVMFKKDGIGMRIWQQDFGSGTAYSNYVDVWHSGNLTNLNQLTNGPGYITSSGSISGSSGSAPFLSALGNYAWSASTNGRDFPSGIQTSFVRAADGYPEYGSVVRVHTYPDDGGSAELYFPYAASFGGTSMRYRLGQYNNAGWTGWKTVIDSDNIGSQSVNYATSAGNADTVDGYHASGLWRSDGATWNPGANITLSQTAAGQEWSFDISRNGHGGGYWHVWDSAHGTILAVNAVNNAVGIGITSTVKKLDVNGGILTRGSEYNQFNTWTDLPGHHGFYSSVHNGAHFYPNNGSYGSWRIDGNRNGWHGLEFGGLSNGNVSLMILNNSTVSGFHNNNVGWQFRWDNGSAYVGKGGIGGGTQAKVWDGVNLTFSLSGSTLTITTS